MWAAADSACWLDPYKGILAAGIAHAGLRHSAWFGMARDEGSEGHHTTRATTGHICWPTSARLLGQS